MGRTQTGVVYLLVAVVIVGVISYGYQGLRKRSATTVQDESLREEVRELSRLIKAAQGDRSAGVKSPPADEGLRREMETMARQVSALARDMETLKNRFNAMPANSDVEKASAEDTETADAGDGKEQPAQESAFRQMHTRYNYETRVEEWAAAAENAIAAEFSTNPEVAGVKLEEIDCRSSLCRVSWQFPAGLSNEESFILENELVAAMTKAGLNASSQIEANGGGISEGYFMYQPPPPSSKRQRER